MDVSPFGALLMDLRRQRRVSQQDLARKLDVHRNTIGKWERGLCLPESKTLVLEIARQLHLNTQDTRCLLEASLTTLSPYWHLPYQRNPFFTGRDDLLHRLHDALHQKQTAVLSQAYALSGLGGIGKTQAALEYAYRYASDYAAIFWISATTQDTLLTGLVTIAEILQLPEKDEHDQNRMILAVKKWLATHGEWLLILDNADDVTVVHNVLPAERSGHVLFTTRAQALGPLAQRIEVETMGMAEGTLFLLRRARLIAPGIFLDHVPQEQLAAAEAIVIEMDFLPLALDQAGAYIEEVGCSLATYLQLYRSHRAELLRRRGHVPGDHPESVATTWSLNFQKIEQDNPAAADLLRLCTFLEPDTIPEELISEGSAFLGPRLQHVTADALKLNEAIEELRKFSLVQREPERKLLRLHRLVQAVLRDVMAIEDRYQWAERAVRATNKVFADPFLTTGSHDATWSQNRRILPQAQTCSVLIHDYTLVFAEAAALLFRTAKHLEDYMLYEQVESLYQQALHIWEQALGPEHPHVTRPLNGLANLYRIQGKYEQAKPLYQQAVHIWKQIPEPEYLEMADSLNGLANLYRIQGQHEQARSLYQQALHILEQTLGPEHFSLASPLNGLASLYHKEEKYNEAEPLYQRALRIRQQALRPDHPAIAQPLYNLAFLYCKQGKYEQAEPLYRQALHIWEQALGPEHPNVAYPLNGLAELYREQEKYAQAEPLYQRTLHILAKARGPEHPSMAPPLNDLANLYHKLGMDQQAESLYLQALSIREHALGEQHIDTAETLHDFAAFQEAQNNSQQAASMYQRALAIREQVMGGQHPKTVDTRTAYIGLLHTMERHDDAVCLEAASLEQSLMDHSEL